MINVIIRSQLIECCEVRESIRSNGMLILIDKTGTERRVLKSDVRKIEVV